MFSLIVTIIAIALVAALALAALYYGAKAYTEATARAEASKVLIQGQQLLGASELYYAERARWPYMLVELTAHGYLQQIPSAALPLDLAVIPTANALTEPDPTWAWEMVTPGRPTFRYIKGVTPEACRHINLRSLGNDGIPLSPHVAFGTQCYGSSDATLKVLVSKEPQSLPTDMPTETVATGPLPTDPADPSWWYSSPLGELRWAPTPIDQNNGGGGTVPPGNGVETFSLAENKRPAIMNGKPQGPGGETMDDRFYFAPGDTGHFSALASFTVRVAANGANLSNVSASFATNSAGNAILPGPDDLRGGFTLTQTPVFTLEPDDGTGPEYNAGWFNYRIAGSGCASVSGQSFCDFDFVMHRPTGNDLCDLQTSPTTVTITVQYTKDGQAQNNVMTFRPTYGGFCY